MSGQNEEKKEKRIGARTLRVNILVLSLLPIFILGGEIIAVLYIFLNGRVDSTFFRRILNQVLIFTSGTLIITCIVVVIIVGRMIATLKRLAGTLTAIADGDLAQKVDEKDLWRRNELGSIARSTDLLNRKLKGLVGQISGAAATLNESVASMERIADSTSQAADHVTANMQEITKELGDQSQQTENVAADVEQIGRMIEQSTDTLNSLRDDMDTIRVSGADGMKTVVKLEKVDEDVSTRMEVIARQTNTTNSSAQQIQSATELIASIAEETNLLALNASIEAARAGEQGRGFAVVADQIQKLAEQSNQSAAAIDKVVQELLVDAGNAVVTMNEIQGSIRKQSETVAEVKNVFTKVNGDILHSVKGIDAIADSMTELNGSKNGLIGASEQLNAISQNSLAITEETTAEAEELDSSIIVINESAVKLRECADELVRDINFFKMGVDEAQ
ncbi:MAG: methyl-accepting chemotaxis protein [Blautia sp.]|nr:methyl-accepting chemotaxis protein [Blautia sp.]MCM1202305.1 methyl-accepting chemotaxis protein [Bacteroides fragilis]